MFIKFCIQSARIHKYAHIQKRIHSVSWFPTKKSWRTDVTQNVLFSQNKKPKSKKKEYMGPLGCLLGMAAISFLRKHATVSITHPHLDQNPLLKELEYFQ